MAKKLNKQIDIDQIHEGDKRFAAPEIIGRLEFGESS